MMPQRASSSSLMRPFVVLALPGMYLLYKYNQYRQQQMETARRRVTERELMHLNTKICPVTEDPKQTKPTVRVPKAAEPEPTAGIQITLLGANTILGHNLAVLLKQVPEVKRLYLYELEKTQSAVAITDDDSPTHCLVRSFGTTWCDLEMCLQNSDIVVFLEIFHVHPEMTIEKRFYYQAPIVKRFTEAIAGYCPQAFLMVCTTPIECMVPLIAELMNEYGWYNPCKIMGCMAPMELRASNLAAQALGLDPYTTRVPCVCGTEGTTLIPLYSRTVDQFEIYEHDAKHLTEVLRMAPISEYRAAGGLAHSARLCEAQALAGVVVMVARSLLYDEVWRLSGFIDTTYSIITPSRFIANTLELGYTGITRCFDLPKMSEYEMDCVDIALMEMQRRRAIMEEWYCKYCCSWDKCDKLLNKLEENEPELATSPEEECVICVNAKATMQTSPCGHRVVCRRCFVKTIQMAVSQRLLPLRCVICRAKILRLRQAPRLVTSKSWQVSSSNSRSWGVPGSVSSYSVGARSVPASASLYSVTSGESSLSGVSSVSSNSGGSASTGTGACTTKLCGGARCGGACLGAVPRIAVPPRARQPASHSLRRSQHHSMKARLQDYQQIHSYTGGPPAEPSGRLPPIREFQREFREGRRDSNTASTSTRIRCAQKIVTQLETSPQKKTTQNFFRTLKPSNKDNPAKSRDHSKETERIKEDPKTKAKKDDKKKKDDENKQYDEKSKKEESNDNKKNEIAEKKKEEKMRLKAEKEAKKEAKLQAKEEERQAKLLAKEEEKQAKLLAKEEKKKAKKEAKLAAQSEKEKNKQSS